MYLDKEIKPDTSVVADNIDKTITYIREGRHHFDMSRWSDCIGGHAVMACLGVSVFSMGRDVEKIASKLLGINESQADSLFCRPASRQQAIETLIRLKNTGKVSWSM